MFDPSILRAYTNDLLLNELTAHFLRREVVLRAAQGVLELDDFGGGEEAHKLLYAIATQHYSDHGALPSREAVNLEVGARVQGCFLADVPDFEEKVKAILDRVFARTEFNDTIAENLLKAFLWHRRVKGPLIDAAERDDVTPDLIEKIYKSSCAVTACSGVDLTEHSAAALLLNPATFAPVTFTDTGFAELTEALGGGFALENETIVAGPTGLGKTTFVVNLAYRVTGAGTPTLYISLEMSAADILKLTLCIAGKIPRRHLRQNLLTTEDVTALAVARTEIAKAPLYILDRAALAHGTELAPDMKAVEAAIQTAVKRHGVQIVVLDYLAKIGPFDEDETKRIAALNAWSYGLAQRLKVHVIALAQQNKASYGNLDKKSKQRYAGLQDVRGVIESVADPDNVIALVRDDWNSAGPKLVAPMRAVVLKARHGPGGKCSLVFDRSTGRIDAFNLQNVATAQRPSV